MKAALLLAAFALLSAVQTHGSSVLSSSDHEHSAEISDLFVWLRQNGAKFPNLKIDKVRQGGLRGVVATKDFKEGQVLAHIPNKCTIDVGHYSLPGAELAVHLLWRQLEYPAWNQSFEPYWQSLPKWGTIYSKENWLIEPEHIALFQEPYLEHYVQINSNWTRDIWAGIAQTETEKQWPAIKAKFPQEAGKITYEQYKHYASLTATYTFVFPNAQKEYQRVMVPLLDLVNHKGIGSNTFVTKDPLTLDYQMVATKPIKAGEEVTHTYNMDNERNDYALINYFFLQRLEPPRLCAIDLPEGHLDQSFPEYDDHYLPHDKAGILHHVEHLENKLKQFPTTAAEDEKLLSAKKSKLSWIDRRVIEFRRERKLTMQLAIQRLKEQAKTAYSLLQVSEVEMNHRFEHSEL